MNISQWKITIIKLKCPEGIKYKVTRRIPTLIVAETKIFDSKKKAKKQFEKWLN